MKLKKLNLFKEVSLGLLTVLIPILTILGIDMSDKLLPIIALWEESWLLQGLIINTLFTLGSIPFSKKIIINKIIRRKKKRITDAKEEIENYFLQQLIENNYIKKKEFENKLYIISSKYDLKVEDIFVNEKLFFQQLTKSILDLNIFDEHLKENIINRIRNDDIISDLDINESRKKEQSDINTDEGDIYEEDEDILFSPKEKKNIFKQVIIISGIIFITLFVLISLIQLFFKAFGINAIILVNTIIALIFIFPIFINGLIHFEEFDEHSRLNFYLLLICFLFIVVNLACVFSTLL